ncbi:MAG TPA: ATP-dependent DNA helicase RecG [Tissierellaceae bacterium]
MLENSINKIKGVGPKREKILNRLGIYTIKDLLYFFPREFEDRSKILNLNEDIIEEFATLEIVTTGRGSVLRPRRNMSILKIPFIQNNVKGELIWFNQDYLKNTIFPGREYKVYGKIQKNGKNYEVHNPIIELKGKEDKIGKIIPIYNLTEGISNNQLISIMNNAVDSYLKYEVELLPKNIENKYNLISKKEAIKNIHFPSDLLVLERAKRRLIFEELFFLQLGLFLFKNINSKNEDAIKFDKKIEMDNLINSLPFQLTNAQKRSFEEISRDMESKKVMNRLLQGDVGSGKTIVAILSMFKAVKNGYQVAMMVPTEVLAKQQYHSLKETFKKFNINVELLTGSVKEKEKNKIKEDLLANKINIVIGTHALIQEDVAFDRLGLVITDEQHRFGVMQRQLLNKKGKNPDCLVMTATPIPRTLAYILYGDLDISVIDELPPNRKKISTFSVGVDYIERINKFIDKELSMGRQAYIVAPLVEESEELKAYSVESLYYKYKKSNLSKYNIDYVHGKLKSDEKDEIMNKFKNKEIDILISTTVIEVGVNVPNASIMVIFNAERFGLAQLHQLRGRVGRGEYKSYCILINEKLTDISLERMKIMIESEDGFEISEKDLELRGPGEFFGTRQHGLPELKIANLFEHREILKLVQLECKDILKEDLLLQKESNKYLKNEINTLFSGVTLDKTRN